MSNEDDDDDESTEEPACPYCMSVDACVHLLLVVDRTFKSVEGGALYEAFEKRLAEAPQDESGDGSDAAFDELVGEVEEIADATADHVTDVPMMSSAYRTFYASDEVRVKSALKKFTRGTNDPTAKTGRTRR